MGQQGGECPPDIILHHASCSFGSYLSGTLRISLSTGKVCYGIEDTLKALEFGQKNRFTGENLRHRCDAESSGQLRTAERWKRKLNIPMVRIVTLMVWRLAV